MRYIVTLIPKHGYTPVADRLPGILDGKISGPCPADRSKMCHDVLGRHHSIVVEAETPEEAGELCHPHHITRIEETE